MLTIQRAATNPLNRPDLPDPNISFPLPTEIQHLNEMLRNTPRWTPTQSGHLLLHRTCPLSGVKRTWLFALMSVYDPKRTLVRLFPGPSNVLA